MGPADKVFFPYKVPTQKPSIPLSCAMERAYTHYPAPTYLWNELYTQFRFTPIEGLDYSNHDGTLTRRDPSKIIRAKGKYYVWYTRRCTETPPRGPQSASDTVPSYDWDLAEIWYATSEDGFVWQEEGLAVPRASHPLPGWRTVCTPDILYWKGKYYLYYQAYTEVPGTHGDDCAASVAWADSPDGPWTPTHEIVLPNGPEGAWDRYSIHDPYPLVYRGRIYLYYKSDCNAPELVRLLGLAIADNPLGPFEKHPLNPVLNSGHETCFFPFREGIAAIVTRHGNENNTIQYAPDGVNFEVAAHASLLPLSPAPYIPDAFSDSGDGKGITWGLGHFTHIGAPNASHSILARFDCDLRQGEHEEWARETEHFWPPEFYFHSGLSAELKRQRVEQGRKELQ